jgi:hypothetical protein
MNMKLINSLVGVGAMLFAAASFASSVTVSPAPAGPIPVGPAAYSAAIVGDFTDVPGGTSGGGITLSWDPSILTLDTAASGFSTDILNVIIGQIIANSGDAGLASASVNQAAGTLTASFTLCPNAFPCAALTSFNMYNLVFDAVNPGTTPVDVGLSLIGDVWYNSDFTAPLTPQPTLGGVTVTVSAVPVPPAVWLFGSGLLGLVGVARRRRAA